MADQMARIEGALGRIEQKIDGHMEADRIAFDAQTTINRDLYEKYATQDQFRTRVKGIAKGATSAVGFLAVIVGAWTKMRGVW